MASLIASMCVDFQVGNDRNSTWWYSIHSTSSRQPLKVVLSIFGITVAAGSRLDGTLECSVCSMNSTLVKTPPDAKVHHHQRKAKDTASLALLFDNILQCTRRINPLQLISCSNRLNAHRRDALRSLVKIMTRQMPRRSCPSLESSLKVNYCS
jgi:hypothetical protein